MSLFMGHPLSAEFIIIIFHQNQLRIYQSTDKDVTRVSHMHHSARQTEIAASLSFWSTHITHAL